MPCWYQFHRLLTFNWFSSVWKSLAINSMKQSWSDEELLHFFKLDMSSHSSKKIRPSIITAKVDYRSKKIKNMRCILKYYRYIHCQFIIENIINLSCSEKLFLVYVCNNICSDQQDQVIFLSYNIDGFAYIT